MSVLLAGGLWILLGACSSDVHAQPEGLLQPRDDAHAFLQRQQTLGHLPGAFLLHQPLSAYEARRYLDTLSVRSASLSPHDRLTLRRLQGTTPAPGAAWVHRKVPWFYADGRHLVGRRTDDYALLAEPLLYLDAGSARQTETSERDGRAFVWRNTRGARLAGHVDLGSGGDAPRVFFETRLAENQERPLRPQFDPVGGTAPRQGRVQYDEGRAVYDYFRTTGVVGLSSKHFEVRFGRARNRWGNGAGSLFLSNYAPVYDQLQVRTSIWRFQYVNLFTRFTDGTSPSDGNPFRPRRYGAFHSLAVDLPGRVQLQLFETVVFATDSTRAQRRSNFDLAYLNPVIFYRSVEHDLGSPDNVLLGAGASWIVTGGLKLYGQFLLDELRVSEIGNAWWGNKWGALLGAHWADPLGLESLTARLEYARQRPYLYSHRGNETAFVHYGDGLGHPAGPNSIDWAFFLDYRPTGRFEATLNAAYTRRGQNTADANFGADPTRSYQSRVSSRGVELLQGVRQDQILLEAEAGYELLPALTASFALRARVTDTEDTGMRRSVTPAVVLRWGLPFASARY